ncbi:GntR family transcriptional regulator [Micromonospora carbonacea]|uniref:Transcriptional regulator, GntR family n=1 Tax=Micromonospora carbonacea TaxID=47853 RepID=A0A1C5AB24_9ACTN|nr:GntR family transcriptional regulator [Micromonospora carbonacea]SCF42423.1 transcriptional regulator, GntR family [Micromonospora carbonacea]
MEADPRPRYAQIADELGRRIDAGILGNGMPFPSDKDIQNEFQVARNTARQALDVLRAQGRIHTIKGRGSFVRPRIPARRLASSRYRADVDSTQERPQTSVTHDYGLAWGQHNPDAVITEEPATAEVAELFEVAEGTPLVRRDLVFRVDGWPTHMSTSYYLADMVAGTWVAGPESEPAPGGAIGHLASLGVRVTRVVETVVSRMPDAREAETLRMSAGPVLAITRKMLAGERVVEVAREIVYPGDGVQLEYRIDL